MMANLRQAAPWLLALGLITVGIGISLEFFADYAVIRQRSSVAEAQAELRRLEAERDLADSRAERDSLERAVRTARQVLESAQYHEARRVESRARLWRWNGASTIWVIAGIGLIAGSIVVLRRTSGRAGASSDGP